MGAIAVQEAYGRIESALSLEPPDRQSGKDSKRTRGQLNADSDFRCLAALLADLFADFRDTVGIHTGI